MGVEALLKENYQELKTGMAEDFVDACAVSQKIMDEAKKRKFTGPVSWTKIQKQRKRGGLSTRLLRAQMLKQRRRYKGRTGRKGWFLRMRPKLLRNLKKAMRTGARVKAVRHRRWTLRRAGSLIKRMKGGIEKFTGRARYRRKKIKRASGGQSAAKSYRRGVNTMAASLFYGISPLMTEAFITDLVRKNVDSEDACRFFAIESSTVESPLFPIAVTAAAYMEESLLADKFYDVDIMDESMYAYFEDFDVEDYKKAEEVLEKICTSELLVKEGDLLDDDMVSNYTVYQIVLKESFTNKIVEAILGSEEEFVSECLSDFDIDDYSSMLVLEKCIQDGVYDLVEDTAK